MELANKIAYYFILLMLSASVVMLSVFLGVHVESYEELRNAGFGLPIPFLYQAVMASGASGYEGSFPYRFGLQMDFLDHDPEYQFDRWNFSLSVLLVYAAVLLVDNRGRWLRKNRKQNS